MIPLPDVTPVTPDLRSPGRYLLRLARLQWRSLLAGVLLGIGWMGSQALIPFVIGRTIDAGVVRGDGEAIALGCGVLAGLAVAQAGFGVTRHRLAVSNWMQAALRTSQLLGRHVSAHGSAVAATATIGEVVSATTNDAPRIGDIFDVSARFAGAVVSFVVVALLVLQVDEVLGLLVLVGVPALTALLGVVVRPLQSRQAAHRESEGRLTALGSDTVAGLRVLRGFGGERQFVARYVERSAAVRVAGVRVAGLQATLDAAHVGLPGAFAVVLTWLGARAALTGRISPGELVTLYGYAAFLVMPLTTATETLGKLVRARVAAGRVIALLRVQARHAVGPVPDGVLPPDGVDLVDPQSGLRVRAGSFVALVSATGDGSAIADRLGRFDADQPADQPADPTGGTADGTTGPAARLGGVGLDELSVDDIRRRILVSETDPRLFTGTLRGELDPMSRHDDPEILAALAVADAGDVLDSLPEGLDGEVTERGRSFSGGQRQRVVLARALLAAPEVLVLVEPTSAVDAHTEARIAQRLRRARAGRTTILTSLSPLLLDRADEVVFLVEGRVAARGRHRDLLADVPGYRDTVTRGEDR